MFGAIIGRLAKASHYRGRKARARDNLASLMTSRRPGLCPLPQPCGWAWGLRQPDLHRWVAHFLHRLGTGIDHVLLRRDRDLAGHLGDYLGAHVPDPQPGALDQHHGSGDHAGRLRQGVAALSDAVAPQHPRRLLPRARRTWSRTTNRSNGPNGPAAVNPVNDGPGTLASSLADSVGHPVASLTRRRRPSLNMSSRSSEKRYPQWPPACGERPVPRANPSRLRARGARWPHRHAPNTGCGRPAGRCRE
jgi:hypothetical protein